MLPSVSQGDTFGRPSDDVTNESTRPILDYQPDLGLDRWIDRPSTLLGVLLEDVPLPTWIHTHSVAWGTTG
jgi:hypothetical protein